MKIYLVGGAVRNRLLGLPVNERDWLVVGATPEQMEARGFRPVGRNFPVFLHPESGEEYALARTEHKTGPGYKGFRFHTGPEVSLEQDLSRRDLRINAMVEDQHGQLIDPMGGAEDLRQRLLHHVSPAFVEDPLRVLRVARIKAQLAPLGFRVAAPTLELMRELAHSGELQHLVAERVWNELQRALSAPAPAEFLRTLRECDALPVVFPEIDALFGVPQTRQHHPEVDTGVHTLMVLEQAARLSKDPAVRFAALVHDLGKARTPREEWPSHKRHDQRGLPVIRALCKRLKAPRRYRQLGELVCRHHLLFHRAFELRASSILRLLENLDFFRRPAQLEEFLLACEADSRGRTGFEQRETPQVEYLQRCAAAARAIRGKTLQDEGYAEEEFAPELRRRRIAAIAALRT